MRVYLLRHGEALDKSADPERPLSEQGRRNVERVAQFAASAGVCVSEIWHSGKARARQSAELLSSHIGGVLKEIDGLQPDDDVRAVKKRIEKANNDIAIAGHLPHLSVLTGKLLRTKEEYGPLFFPCAGLAALELFEEDVWQVRWMIAPEVLPG